MSDHVNRRKFFRLKDSFNLRIRILDDQALESITEDFDRYRMDYCLKSHAQNQKDVNQPRLLQIRKRHQDIALYLEYLETRLIELSEQVERLSNQREESEVTELLCEGDLSANGIKIYSPVKYDKNQNLEISMVLSTSEIRVLVLGKVVRTESSDEGIHKVSITYTHIHDEDKENIVRHLVKLQQEMLKASR